MKIVHSKFFVVSSTKGFISELFKQLRCDVDVLPFNITTQKAVNFLSVSSIARLDVYPVIKCCYSWFHNERKKN